MCSPHFEVRFYSGGDYVRWNLRAAYFAGVRNFWQCRIVLKETLLSEAKIGSDPNRTEDLRFFEATFYLLPPTFVLTIIDDVSEHHSSLASSDKA